MSAIEELPIEKLKEYTKKLKEGIQTIEEKSIHGIQSIQNVEKKSIQSIQGSKNSCMIRISKEFKEVLKNLKGSKSFEEYLKERLGV